MGFVFLMAPVVQASVVTGEAAPDFILSDTKGVSHQLSSFKGKIVILEWTNPECPFVKKFYGPGAMQKWQADYKAKGVVWLSINSSASGKQGNYAAPELDQLLSSQGFAGTAALVDPEGKAGQLYGAATTPQIFVIDPEGKVAYQGAIDDKAGTDPAEIALAKNYAVAALDEVLAGKPVSVQATKSYGCSVKY
jgi:peroxiredoxin